METKTITDLQGRKYEVYQDGELQIAIGPPAGLVDEMELPEPFATKLHNALHSRGILNYESIRRKPKELQGALQDVLSLDIQKLAEIFYKYEQENSNG